jgi:predicted nucleic acid-binding protein
MRLYLDVCCLNRFLDEPSQLRVRNEADAVRRILDLCARRLHVWVSSDVVEDEILRTPDPQRRAAVLAILRDAPERLQLTAEVLTAARAYHGLKAFDALHVALAEIGGCDALLTTDDAFLHGARRVTPPLRIRVENPLAWLKDHER